MTEAETLRVTFIGTVTVLEPGEQLTLGRQADLRLDEDDDHFLHRTVGRLQWHRSMWWLENLGRSIELVLRDPFGADEKWIRAGDRPEPLTRQEGVIWLRSRTRPYEIEYNQADDPTPPLLRRPRAEGERTWDLGTAHLGEGQRLLLTALAEGRLRGNHTLPRLPRNADVAKRLGWSIPLFNRRLDGLCNLFTSLGVDGLIGTEDQRATNRRAILIDHVLKEHLITRAELDLLLRFEKP